MKKGKIFANVVYYLFTFIIGILLAVFLPYFYMLYGESVSIIYKSLDKGDYTTAISIVGGYYESEYTYQTDFENGGGMVLFNAASLVPAVSENGETISDAKLHKAYSGFVYGLKKNYNVTKEIYNHAKLIITDLDNATHEISVLDSDSNKDGKKDTNATCLEYGFMYIDLDQDTVKSLKKIEIIDCDGNVFQEVNLSLDFSEQFFVDVSDFVNEYNANYKSDKLPELDKEFREKSDKYCISSDGVVKSSADKKAAIIVVVYFVVIYLIGDLLIGNRYTIKFFKWLLVKVFKVKFKQKKPKHSEVFGHDYFCKLTIAADVSEIDGFNESLQVRFSNENGEITYVLLKSRNYTETNSVKAGEYVNLWVDLDDKYVTQNLPDTLEVEGYQKTITFKILKRED